MNKLLRTCFDWFSHGLLPWLCLVVLLASSVQAHANPGDILFQDDFERSNPGSVGNGWVVTPANTDSACQGVSPTLVSGETFPVATITIAGSQKVPVNGITVAGQQIMAASYGGSTSITGGSGVAAKIAERINSCTSAITGNCTVAGYSASRSGSSVIITGPATATATSRTPSTSICKVPVCSSMPPASGPSNTESGRPIPPSACASPATTRNCRSPRSHRKSRPSMSSNGSVSTNGSRRPLRTPSTAWTLTTSRNCSDCRSRMPSTRPSGCRRACGSSSRVD